MIKFLYLAKRKPGFTPDAFNARWRMHGAVGMSTAFSQVSLLYVQAEPVRPAPFAGATLEHDAIAYLVVTDGAFGPDLAPDQLEGHRINAEDEFKTFARPIRDDLIFLQEQVLVAGDPGGFTAFLFFAGAADAEAAGRAFAGNGKLHRLALNTRRHDISLGEGEVGLSQEAVLEVSAGNLRTLKDIVEETVLPVAPDIMVATREVVYWDKLSRA